MGFYPYEYFCGANVVVEVEGQPLYEAAGLSFNVKESRVPLYGYSSRHFDAMARGQVLVQGSLVVNYIHQDYLLRSIETGREFRGDVVSQLNATPGANAVLENARRRNDLFGALDDEQTAKAVTQEILADPDLGYELVQSMQNKFWPQTVSPPGVQFRPEGTTLANNPHDMNSSIDLRVTFGSRSIFNGFSGVTGLLLSGVYFVSRGVPVQIDEEVIVEEYSFLARNVHALDTQNTQLMGDFENVEGAAEDIAFVLTSNQPAEILFEKPDGLNVTELQAARAATRAITNLPLGPVNFL